MRGCAQSFTLWQQPTIETTSGIANPKFLGTKTLRDQMFDLRLATRDEHGSRLDRTAIFLKIGGSGLDRTEKIFFFSL